MQPLEQELKLCLPHLLGKSIEEKFFMAMGINHSKFQEGGLEDDNENIPYLFGFNNSRIPLTP